MSLHSEIVTFITSSFNDKTIRYYLADDRRTSRYAFVLAGRVHAIAISVFTERAGRMIRDSAIRVLQHTHCCVRAHRTAAAGITRMPVIPSDRSPDRSLDRRLDRPLDRSRGERGWGRSERNGNSVPISCTEMSLRNVHRMFSHRHTLVSKLIPRRRGIFVPEYRTESRQVDSRRMRVCIGL